MSLTPKIILDDFERHRWNSKPSPMDGTLQLMQEQPEAMVELVIGAMDRRIASETFIDTAIDLMEDEAFTQIAANAWERLRQGEQAEIVRGIVDMAALQWPSIFAPHWTKLIEMVHGPDSRRSLLYQDKVAWRALDEESIGQWYKNLNEGEGSNGERVRIARALLYCRRSFAVIAGWDRISADTPIGHLWDAGYSLKGRALRSLHSENPLHIRFDSKQRKHMLADEPQWKRIIHRFHPTWGTNSSSVGKASMGGALDSECGLCKGHLHRLICLPVPQAEKIGSDTSLAFGTCMTCLGWESDGALYYRHDAHGLPSVHPSQVRAGAMPQSFEVTYKPKPLMEAEVDLFQAPERWAWQDWGVSNGRQNMNRIGGAPSWVQSAYYPQCLDCGETMRFVMQLDSGLPQEDGVEMLWGSGGANYTYWCNECRTSAHLWQCT